MIKFLKEFITARRNLGRSRTGRAMPSPGDDNYCDNSNIKIDTLANLNNIIDPMSKWEITQFTTEYIIYDQLEDKLILQVFSQGCAGDYFVLSETETFYPQLFDDVPYYCNTRYVWIDVL